MESRIYEYSYDETLILDKKFPDYHFAMLNDKTRNKLYKEALQYHSPNRVILDPGSGSGLL